MTTMINRPYSVVADEIQGVQHLVDVIAEDPEVEQQRAQDFSCGCTHFEGRPCIQQFTNEEVFDIRISMQGLTEGKPWACLTL